MHSAYQPIKKIGFTPILYGMHDSEKNCCICHCRHNHLDSAKNNHPSHGSALAMSFANVLLFLFLNKMIEDGNVFIIILLNIPTACLCMICLLLSCNRFEPKKKTIPLYLDQCLEAGNIHKARDCMCEQNV